MTIPIPPGMTQEEQIAQAQDMLAAYRAAEKAALLSQSYSIGQQSLTRADLSSIRAGINYYTALLNMLLGVGRRQAKNVIPVDRYWPWGVW